MHKDLSIHISSNSRLFQIQCWTLTDYTKCVFLDADTLILQNSDELFEREEFSAAPDAGWPDCFNSGVFVFRPNLNTFKVIVKTVGDVTFNHQARGPSDNSSNYTQVYYTSCITGSCETCDGERLI